MRSWYQPRPPTGRRTRVGVAAVAVLAAWCGVALAAGTAGAATVPPLVSAKPGEGVARAYQHWAASGTAPRAQKAPSSDLPSGPDVSAWEHPGGAAIDWTAVRQAGHQFTIIKSTEGTFYANPYFHDDWNGSRAAGLIHGSYHFARPALPLSTAVEQAGFFLATVPFRFDAGELPPILDLEETGGLGQDDLQDWAQTFLLTIETATGRAPIIYTYPQFWSTAMGGTTAFSSYPLWIATYNGQSTPGALPGGWPSYTLWQYTASGNVPGISGPVDINVSQSRSKLWSRTQLPPGSRSP